MSRQVGAIYEKATEIGVIPAKIYNGGRNKWVCWFIDPYLPDRDLDILRTAYPGALEECLALLDSYRLSNPIPDPRKMSLFTAFKERVSELKEETKGHDPDSRPSPMPLPEAAPAELTIEYVYDEIGGDGLDDDDKYQAGYNDGLAEGLKLGGGTKGTTPLDISEARGEAYGNGFVAGMEEGKNQGQRVTDELVATLEPHLARINAFQERLISFANTARTILEQEKSDRQIPPGTDQPDFDAAKAVLSDALKEAQEKVAAATQGVQP